MRRTLLKKTLVAMLCGGTLLQVGSCATQFAPLVLSLAESAFLTYALSGIF